MKLPIELLKQVNDWGLQLDCESNFTLTDRQIAIKETLRLLLSLTYDEYHHQDDPYSKYYTTVVSACVTLSDH